MATSHTALSAAEDERCSCVETTTAVGEVSSGFGCVMNHNSHNVFDSSVNVDHDGVKKQYTVFPICFFMCKTKTRLKSGGWKHTY